jgi:maltooligosyltrehalose trehalohydrolase
LAFGWPLQLPQLISPIDSPGFEPAALQDNPGGDKRGPLESSSPGLAEPNDPVSADDRLLRPTEWRATLGAVPEPGGARFRCWAPRKALVEVLIEAPSGLEIHKAVNEGDGWFEAFVPGAAAGTRYRYRLDGSEVIPDPLSRSQPSGIHGASEIVDPRKFCWTDGGWRGIPIDRAVIYEVHIGTATPVGTFDAFVPLLENLADLGVTALEIMPVGQFPGARNWGYDGVYWFAPAACYGGSEGLRRLVNAAHRSGLAVILDVVYNHFGPEGNYLAVMSEGAIFTDRHQTPWGAGINFDGEGCAAVRRIVLENTLHWVHEYHLDGLRFDATHAIIDDSPQHIVSEVTESLRAATSRQLILIAEDDRNDRRVVSSITEGGLGLDAVWADDFHHQIRRCIAGDNEGYFTAYSGDVTEIVRTLDRGWYYEGQIYPFTGAPRGTTADGLSPCVFIHCIQNHDQVGNRAFGDRLHHQIELANYRAASALLLLSPYTPLLWMGQEWATDKPFLYFTDHPEELGQRVKEGRRSEFSRFSDFSNPAERQDIPDPQAEETFLRSKLDWDEALEEPHSGIWKLYQTLAMLRHSEPALRSRRREDFQVFRLGKALGLHRTSEDSSQSVLLLVSFEDHVELEFATLTCINPRAPTTRTLLVATEETRFGGSGDWGSYNDSSDVLSLDGPGGVALTWNNPS